MIEELIFTILATGGLISAVYALHCREIVHSVMFLAAFFGIIAGLFLFLSAHLLGWVQLIVYAGGVTVLILFAIMLTRRTIFVKSEVKFKAPTNSLYAVFMLALVTILIILPLLNENFTNYKPAIFSLSELSDGLFVEYSFLILVLGFFLLTAIVAAVYICKTEESDKSSNSAHNSQLTTHHSKKGDSK